MFKIQICKGIKCRLVDGKTRLSDFRHAHYFSSLTHPGRITPRPFANTFETSFLEMYI